MRKFIVSARLAYRDKVDFIAIGIDGRNLNAYTISLEIVGEILRRANNRWPGTRRDEIKWFKVTESQAGEVVSSTIARHAQEQFIPVDPEALSPKSRDAAKRRALGAAKTDKTKL